MATLPLQSVTLARRAAAGAISESGTQNHTVSAVIRDPAMEAADALISFASFRARSMDEGFAREMTCSMEYPADRSAGASVAARFPAPIIAIVGLADRFRAMPG